MTNDSFSTRFSMPQSPEAVFDAICDVRGWWGGEITGAAAKVGDSFTYRYEQMHQSTQLVTEVVPGRRVVWRVTEGSINFVADRSEWTGTEIVFEIVPTAGGSELIFTHQGLVPKLECFTDCSGGWTYYIDKSLKAYIGSREMADAR